MRLVLSWFCHKKSICITWRELCKFMRRRVMCWRMRFSIPEEAIEIFDLWIVARIHHPCYYLRCPQGARKREKWHNSSSGSGGCSPLSLPTHTHTPACHTSNLTFSCMLQNWFFQVQKKKQIYNIEKYPKHVCLKISIDVHINEDIDLEVSLII